MSVVVRASCELSCCCSRTLTNSVILFLLPSQPVPFRIVMAVSYSLLAGTCFCGRGGVGLAVTQIKPDLNFRLHRIEPCSEGTPQHHTTE